MTLVRQDNLAHLDLQVKLVTQEPLEIRVQLLPRGYQVTQVQVDLSDSQVHQDLLVLQDPEEPQETMASRVMLDFLDQKGNQVLQAIVAFLEV